MSPREAGPTMLYRFAATPQCFCFGPPTQRIKHLIPSSLVTRIVIVALLLLTAITSILSYVLVSEDFAEKQANLDAEIQLIVRRFVPIATRATFQLDVQLAEQVIESILSAEYVIAAKITDDLGQELATHIRYLEIAVSYTHLTLPTIYSV